MQFTVLFSFRFMFCVSLPLPLGRVRWVRLLFGGIVRVAFVPCEVSGQVLVMSSGFNLVLQPSGAPSSICVCGCVFRYGSAGPALVSLPPWAPVKFCTWGCVFHS